MSSPIIGPGRSRRGPRLDDLKRALTQILLGGLPAAITAFILLDALRAHGVAYDFHWSYYPAAQRLLQGGDVYSATPLAVAHGGAFTYPALAAVLLAPFALLGRTLADHLYLILCLLTVPATLRLAGVRDWRVHGIVLLWLPVIVGWQGGNVSLPLALLGVIAWRRRDHPLSAGLTVAVAISVKPLMWPLALWLLATRRWRAAAAALASGLAINLLAWYLVGWGRIESYVRLSGKLVAVQWRNGYGLPAVVHQLGGGHSAGQFVLVAVSAAMTVALLRAGFIQRDDRRAIVLAMALALIASPIVWSHYFVVLLVPLAIHRPRLSLPWALPLAMCLCPTTTPAGWQLALAWLVFAACLTPVLRDGSAGRRSADRRPRTQRHEILVTTG